MIIFPAIDLKEGKCVRLYQGDMNQATIFNDSPANQAKEFENLGFKFIHIVDLDGAVLGKSMNQESIKEILANITIPIQLGGGIRSIAAIENWLELGVNRVILGTAAIKDPELVIKACKKFPGKIVVGIDAKSGMVATEGWVESSGVTTIDLAKKFEDCGVSAIIYTDISRDGTLSGFDVDGTKNLAEQINIPVIISGGISSIEDVYKARHLKQYGVEGAIVGRAFYDKKISHQDLLQI